MSDKSLARRRCKPRPVLGFGAASCERAAVLSSRMGRGEIGSVFEEMARASSQFCT